MGRVLPSGTVTFLFTDVEGSTPLLGELGAEAYAAELMGHRRVLREAVARHGGVEVDTQGDAFFVAFASAREAVAAAAEAQAKLAKGGLRVRMGLHTGEPLLTDQGYVGMDVHRAARIAAVAHGGQVLLSQATHDLVDASVDLRELGEHRLKDLSAPDRLYQLGSGEFPPLRSLFRTNLPIPSTPFIGREQELAEVIELLEREDARLVTLTGVGGTGKTRLAAQAAGMASGVYRDGVWWVPLATVRDGKLVLETARQALGARTDLAAHIGDRSMLLLFDNFEQVVDAGVDVASVLAACENLHVLVTSREPLHVGGEHEYPVPTLLHDEAIGLFAARATAVDPSFRPNAEVSEICVRLDDLPLAIELAAARIKALSTSQILERLGSRLPLLTGGARDLPQRQRTLRATIEWSYDLLTGDEQLLFARLAVFVGGCTIEAAEDVAEADVDTLQSLVDKSLLRRQGERYWMLATIHEFARERLVTAGEFDAIATRHARHFLAVAERAEPAFGTSEEAWWIELLARDHDNFRAALAHCDGSPLRLRLACALWRFWLRRGHHEEGRRWLEAALTTRGAAPPADVARGLRAAAVFARVHGDLDASEQLSLESISIARRIGDRGLEMHGIGTRANVALMRSDYSLAAELLVEVEALCRELGDEKSVAVTIGNRAYLAMEMGDSDLALTLAQDALASSRKIGDATNAVVAALNSALAALGLDKRQVARQALVEALEGARALGHRAFLVDGLIIAAAIVADEEPRTATGLLAAGDRGRADLGIELAPIERGVRASVAIQLSGGIDRDDADEIATGDLDAVLDAAAARALESLRPVENG